MKPMKPTFDPKRLPVEYIPLSQSNLKVGMKFGPIEFEVKKESHEKSVRLLEQSDLRGTTNIKHPFLLPSEIWAWARVLSPYFGRLNEVVVSGAKWKLVGTAKPGEKLKAQSMVVKIEKRNDLPFATMVTETRNLKGKLLLHSTDEVLLLHDVDRAFYSERNKAYERPANPLSMFSKKVYHRYNWDPNVWKNNEHTDAYAQKFGYERGLPEFITYMDNCFAAILMLEGKRAYKRTLNLQKVLPIYKDEKVDIFVEKEKSGGYKVRLFRGNQERVVHSVK